MSFRVSRLNSEQREVVASNDALRSYLEGLEREHPTTPRSWLFEGQEGEDVLDRWMRKLDTLKSGTENEQLIYAFDCKQLEKFGPQGGHPPVMEGLQEQAFLDQYEPTKIDRVELPPLDEVLGIRPHSLHYKGYDAVLKSMHNRETLATNSGWDKFTRRDKVKLVSVTQARDGRAFEFPAIILFRYYNGKLRIVWMYPMAMNLLEYTATQPLQDAIQRATKYVTPWSGFEVVKQRFTELWAKHPCAFGGDTTAMDAHMQGPQLTGVGNAAAPLFSAPQLMLDTLEHVGTIDVVIGVDSIIRNQAHGVASGSGWTQLCETIMQICRFHTWIKKHNLPLTVDDGMGIGDDYVWFFDEMPDPKEVVKFWDEVGLPGKPEKQSAEYNTCTFLQRLFIKGFFSRADSTVLGGVYPTIRALKSLLYPERWFNPKDWSSKAFCIRVFQILENTVDHPLFEEFVKFVVGGHPDLLPFAKQSAAQIDRDQRAVRKRLPGLVPTYNQEKRDKPLSEYEAIRFAATL